MGLYTVSGGTTGRPSDLDQIIDALTGKNDVGQIVFFQALTVPTAPSVAVNAITGVLNGNYQYAVSFITGYANSSGGVTDQGNTSGGTASATVSPATQQVNLTNIPVGPQGVTARNLYRTKAGGTTFYFLQQIADNVTTSWTDNVADASITVVMPSTNTTGTKLVGDGSLLTNLPVTPLSSTTPTSETEGTTGAVGTGTNAAREDHRHAMPATYTPSAHKSSHATGGADTLSPSDIGADVAGASVAAIVIAETYADTKDADHVAAADPHSQYAFDTDLSNLAGVGRTTETVKGNADALTEHQADYVHQASKIYAYKNFGGAL